VNGVRSSKSSGNKIALYQPLTLLDLVVYHRDTANIHRIKEIRCNHPYRTVTSDVKKSTVAMFLNEIVNKTVKEEAHAGELFGFLHQSLLVLDDPLQDCENFHLIFLVKLSRLLGFGAHHVHEISGPRILNNEEEHALTVLLAADYETPMLITNMQRRMLLDHFLLFYREHVETLGEIKSVSILKEILS
jgi:DNA repair protein RecO (recombination protein O)